MNIINGTFNIIFLQKVGHNVVALDREGNVRNKTVVNTESDPTAATTLISFIRDLPNNTYVLIATQGDFFDFTTGAQDALRSLGATDPLIPPKRGSWALAGFKGPKKPVAVSQVSNPMETSIIEVEFALYG